MVFSFWLVPTLFYFSHIVKAAAAVSPAPTDTPQLLQLPTLQQPSFAKAKSVNLSLPPPPGPFRIHILTQAPKLQQHQFRPPYQVAPSRLILRHRYTPLAPFPAYSSHRLS